MPRKVIPTPVATEEPVFPTVAARELAQDHATRLQQLIGAFHHATRSYEMFDKEV